MNPLPLPRRNIIAFPPLKKTTKQKSVLPPQTLETINDAGFPPPPSLSPIPTDHCGPEAWDSALNVADTPSAASLEDGKRKEGSIN